MKVEGAHVIADLLKTNTTLTSIKYAPHALNPYCQQPITPLTRSLFIRVCSLDFNGLKVEGAQVIAELLKTNTTLTSVRYATTCPNPYCQQPLMLRDRPRWQSLGQQDGR
jgi:hypothetical protein